MSDVELRSARFRREREDDWRRLEALLRRLESGRTSQLSDEDLLAVPVLYRAALSALSVARDLSLDQGLLDYLETLCSRGYFLVYGARPRLRSQILDFFRSGWPAAARGLWRETLASGAFMTFGVFAAFWLCAQSPDWYYAFVPEAQAQGRDPTASAAALRTILYAGGGGQPLQAFAAFLFAHNAQIAVLAFALGFAFGVPTALLVFTNGCALGALFSLYAAKGLALPLGGWLMIHGVTELLATTLAGAAGFHIGGAIAFPGAASRLEAGGAAGRRSATLMAGVVVMLGVAALLEGVGRQLVVDDRARYLIAGVSGAGWLLYLYAPRRPPE